MSAFFRAISCPVSKTMRTYTFSGNVYKKNVHDYQQHRAEFGNIRRKLLKFQNGVKEVDDIISGKEAFVDQDVIEISDDDDDEMLIVDEDEDLIADEDKERSRCSLHLVNPAQFDVRDQLGGQIEYQLQKTSDATLTHREKTQKMRYALENEEHLRTVRVAIIAGDGNCLFGAMAHQLFGSKINSRKHKQETHQLRQDVVEYIRKDYTATLQAGLLDGALDEQDFPVDPDEHPDAAHIFLTDYLPRSGVWGGQESLAAVQRMYNASIFIFQENNGITRMHLHRKVPERTILLALREGGGNRHNHYDSVFEIPSDDLPDVVEEISRID